VFSELGKARKQFVLENELHIIYQVRENVKHSFHIFPSQVVPIFNVTSWPDFNWMDFLDMWGRLSPDMKRVADLVGVQESYLVRAARNSSVKDVIPS